MTPLRCPSPSATVWIPAHRESTATLRRPAASRRSATVKYSTDIPTSTAPMASHPVTPSSRNITALATANTGIRLRTTAAPPASTRAITELNSRKLTAKPATPVTAAAIQNRGATASSRLADSGPSRRAVTASETTVAAVNCQVVSDKASEPSSKRFATTVYRLALSTPPATNRSPAAEPPELKPASTISPATPASTDRTTGLVIRSLSTTAASKTTKADSSPSISPPLTAVVADRPKVSPR